MQEVGSLELGSNHPTFERGAHDARKPQPVVADVTRGIIIQGQECGSSGYNELAVLGAKFQQPYITGGQTDEELVNEGSTRWAALGGGVTSGNSMESEGLRMSSQRVKSAQAANLRRPFAIGRQHMRGAQWVELLLGSGVATTVACCSGDQRVRHDMQRQERPGSQSGCGSSIFQGLGGTKWQTLVGPLKQGIRKCEELKKGRSTSTTLDQV